MRLCIFLNRYQIASYAKIGKPVGIVKMIKYTNYKIIEGYLYIGLRKAGMVISKKPDMILVEPYNIKNTVILYRVEPMREDRVA